MAITFKDDAVVQTALGIGPQGSLFGIFAAPDNPWDIITECPQHSIYFKTGTGEVFRKSGTGYTIGDWEAGISPNVQQTIEVKDSGALVYTGPVVLDYLNSLAATNPSGADVEVKLVGDAEAPGNNYVYGTNESGTKGWYEIGDILSPVHTLQLDWRFDTSTTASSPASGRFRMNNANPALVTELYIHDVTRSGLDASAILDALHTGGLIYIQQGNDATRFVLAKIASEPVDNTGWWTITVTIEDSGTLFENNKDCLFVFVVDAAGVGDDDIEYNASEGQSSRTFTSYQQKVSLAFTAEASDYWIMVSAEVAALASGGRVAVRAQVDNTDTFVETDDLPDGGAYEGWGTVSAMYKTTLAAGARTIDLDYASTESGKEARIRKARITAWKVT